MMSKITLVDYTNTEAIINAERLLKDVKSGHVKAFTVVVELSDGCYSLVTNSDLTNTAIAGMMYDCAHQLLSNNHKEW
ncbi:hypothetical protein [Caudoviricetes sp.]|nr:hypothetical protein [Caudoviricetes sp.]